MPYTFTQMLWILALYSILGWCLEVLFFALNTRKFANRGFLNGPYCPIYGFGVLIVGLALTPLKPWPVWLFLASIALTTTLEFFVGLVLEKVFGEKWWDYTGTPCNLMGYVCLRASLGWGVGCLAVMYGLLPATLFLVDLIPEALAHLLLGAFYAILVCDTAVTVCTLSKFKRRLALIDEMGANIRKVSDSIGEGLFEGASAVLKATDRGKSEIEELKQRYEELTALMKTKVLTRLRRAYPSIRALKAKSLRELLNRKKNS